MLLMACKNNMPTPCLMWSHTKELDLPRSEIHGAKRATMDLGVIRTQDGLHRQSLNWVTPQEMMESFSCHSRMSSNQHTSDRLLWPCTMNLPRLSLTKFLRKRRNCFLRLRSHQNKSSTSLLKEPTLDRWINVLINQKTHGSTLISTRVTNKTNTEAHQAFFTLKHTWEEACTTLLLANQIWNLRLVPTA